MLVEIIPCATGFAAGCQLDLSTALPPNRNMLGPSSLKSAIREALPAVKNPSVRWVFS